MVNILPAITAINAMNASLMLRNSQLARSRQKNYKLKKPNPKPHPLLKKKFAQSWNSQEERLKELEIKEYNHFSDKKTGTGRIEYRYKSGQTAKVEITDKMGYSIERFDERGNQIETEMDLSSSTSIFRYTYYPNSNQKEFEYSDVCGIRHYNQDGIEDTERYLAKLQMVTKRLKYEEQTGVTLRKMSKIEKVVAKRCKDKPEMTMVEKLLARKVKRSGK